MSLPPTYSSSTQYLKDVLAFLQVHQWIYNFPNTHILAQDVLKHIPIDWQQHFSKFPSDIKHIVDSKFKHKVPNSLLLLLKQIQSLQPRHISSISKECDYNFVHNSSLSKKKIHEILHFAPLIHNICQEQSFTKCILDVGCGLGYLSHLLNEKYQYKVLGIDCSTKYIHLAYKNQEKFHKMSKNDVIFREHYINESSLATLDNSIRENFGEAASNVCMVGLHACADLSITVLDLFSKLDSVNSLIIMPCCYHRLKLKQKKNNLEYFEHFPASNILKELFNEFSAAGFIRTPFLRLACQQTATAYNKMTQEELNQQSRDMLYRAILQKLAVEEKCEVRRLKRKSGVSMSNSGATEEERFKAYVNNLQCSHKLVRGDVSYFFTSDSEFKGKLLKKWSQHKGDCIAVKVLAALQASIQSLCENAILLDRIEFLKERGYQSYIRTVTNDGISPRCHALIARKFSSVNEMTFETVKGQLLD